MQLGLTFTFIQYTVSIISHLSRLNVKHSLIVSYSICDRCQLSNWYNASKLFDLFGQLLQFIVKIKINH